MARSKSYLQLTSALKNWPRRLTKPPLELLPFCYKCQILKSMMICDPTTEAALLKVALLRLSVYQLTYSLHRHSVLE